MITDANGEQLFTRNLNKWCKYKGISYSSMLRSMISTCKASKGYKLVRFVLDEVSILVKDVIKHVNGVIAPESWSPVRLCADHGLKYGCKGQEVYYNPEPDIVEDDSWPELVKQLNSLYADDTSGSNRSEFAAALKNELDYDYELPFKFTSSQLDKWLECKGQLSY